MNAPTFIRLKLNNGIFYFGLRQNFLFFKSKTSLLNEHCRHSIQHLFTIFFSSEFANTMEEKLKAQAREYESQMEYRKHVQEFIDKFR